MLVVPGYTVQDVELLHLFAVECVQYTPLCHINYTIYNSHDQVETFVTDLLLLYTINCLINLHCTLIQGICLIVLFESLGIVNHEKNVTVTCACIYPSIGTACCPIPLNYQYYAN